MRLSKIIVALFLFPSVVFAQGWQIGNPVGTPRALPTPGTTMNRANVDVYGNQQISVGPGASGTPSFGPINPGTGATDLGKAEDAVAGSGWTGVGTLGVVNTTGSSLAANGDFAPFAVGNAGMLYTDINATFTNGGASILKLEDTASANGDAGVATFGVVNTVVADIVGATGDYVPQARTFEGIGMDAPVYSNDLLGSIQLGKLEDTAAASGDALVGVAGVINTTLTSPAAAGDYAALGLGRYGQQLSTPVIDTDLLAGTASALRSEDSAAVSTDTVSPIAYVARDPIIASVSATNDYINPSTDLGGRTITTLAPAGESFQACSASITNTTPTQIKAAVASNRHYITSVTCTNASAVPSLVNIIDGGASAMWTGGMGSSTLDGIGQFNQTFPVPLRGTSGAAVNATVITTGTSTICCISGYVSVN
jgi:hypothetical protein